MIGIVWNQKNIFRKYITILKNNNQDIREISIRKPSLLYICKRSIVPSPYPNSLENEALLQC